MMDAIPLSAPDGTIYSYACGKCHRVRARSDMSTRSFSQVDLSASASKTMAEECCACRKCGKFTGRELRVCAKCQKILSIESAAHEEALAKDDALRLASLDKALDLTAALALESYMRQLSEGCFSAGWMSSLEFALWKMLVASSEDSDSDSDSDFGFRGIYAEEKQRLRKLSEKAGGWWTFRRFMPFEEWVPYYEKRGA